MRRRAGELVAVGAVALVASLAMTAVYHARYSDFRPEKQKPMTGDLIWSAPNAPAAATTRISMQRPTDVRAKN